MHDPIRLDARDAARLARHAAAADASGALHPVTLALAHRRGWPRLLAPREAAGSSLAVPELVDFLESLAAADGACGWFVTLCAGAGWFAGFWPPALASAVMRTRRVCLAGSGAVGGTARRQGDGWRISGRWPHATGAPHATHFTMNASVDVGGVRAFLVPATEVEVLPTWCSMGLRATASHAFRVRDAWVPDDHAFSIGPAAARSDDALYRFPFASLADVTLAANVGGMARGFLRLAPVEADASRLEAARGRCLRMLRDAWASTQRGEVCDEAALRESALAWAHAARETVDALYPSCGLAAADPRTPLNRVWRDLHTATQHALLRPRAAESVPSVLQAVRG